MTTRSPRSPKSPKSPIDSFTKRKKRLSFDFIFTSESNETEYHSSPTTTTNLAQQKAKQAENNVKQQKGVFFDSVSNPNSSMFVPPKQLQTPFKNRQNNLQGKLENFSIQNVLQNVSVQIKPTEEPEPEKKINDLFMMKNIIHTLKIIEDEEEEEDGNEGKEILETCYDMQSTDTLGSYHAKDAVASIIEGISSNSMDLTFDDTKTSDSTNVIENCVEEEDKKKDLGESFSSMISLDSNQNRDHSFGSQIENHLLMDNSTVLFNNTSLLMTDDSFTISE